LDVLRRRSRQLPKVEKGWTRRRDDDPRRARLQLGHALLAERPRHADRTAIDGRDNRLLWIVEREERNAAAVLFERDVQRRKFRVRRVGCDVERSGLTDDAGRLVDGEVRRRAATGDDVRDSSREREEHEKRSEPAEHGSNHTSLLISGVLTGAWRYRLGVRTRGSQPRDRGSNPRTATRSATCKLSVGSDDFLCGV